MSDDITRRVVLELVPPQECDDEVFRKGVGVAVLPPLDDYRETELRVQQLAEITNTRTDWHNFSGRVVIKTLGNPSHVMQELMRLWPDWAAQGMPL